jgi:hypothetical protein
MKEASIQDRPPRKASTSDLAMEKAKQRSIELFVIAHRPPLGTEIDLSAAADTGGKEKVVIVITDLDTTVRGYITG